MKGAPVVRHHLVVPPASRAAYQSNHRVASLSRGAVWLWNHPAGSPADCSGSSAAAGYWEASRLAVVSRNQHVDQQDLVMAAALAPVVAAVMVVMLAASVATSDATYTKSNRVFVAGPFSVRLREISSCSSTKPLEL